jgi:hypothetical protein
MGRIDVATSRKRKSPGAVAPGRVKKSVILSAELARQLEVYAAASGRDQSDVIADALRPVLAGFGWFTRSGQAGRPQTADPAGPRLSEAG